MPVRISGSSPLARGLPIRDSMVTPPSGIIPARAGFTCPRAPHHRVPADHPRSRGVYCIKRGAEFFYAGSSPLARGLPMVPDSRRKSDGIIPARAGFTNFLAISPSPRPDHPRSRGVYGVAALPPLLTTGSSPLARGLPEPGASQREVAGIIPARAGFTSALVISSSPPWDHPRSRGVYFS